jgi:hypothetical protein
LSKPAAGDFWIDHQDAGLFHAVGSKVVEQIPWAKLGYIELPPFPGVGSRAWGLWLGQNEGRVIYYKDHQVRESYGTNDGLVRDESVT